MTTAMTVLMRLSLKLLAETMRHGLRYPGPEPKGSGKTPTRPRLGALLLLAKERSALEHGGRAIERGLFTTRPVNLVELRGDQIFTMPLNERSERLCVKLASGYTQAYRQFFGGLKYSIRN